MFRTLNSLIFLLLFTCFFSTNSLKAQIQKNASTYLVGVVLDITTGDAMNNAVVTVSDKQTNINDAIVTDDDGSFVFRMREGGVYEVLVEKGNLSAEKVIIDTKDLTRRDDSGYYNIAISMESNNIELSPEKVNYEKTFSAKFDEEIVFSINIGEFAEPLNIDSRYLKPIRSDLSIKTLENGKTVYLVGAFDDIEAAEKMKTSLIKIGYIDADIIACANNTPLNMSKEEAIKYLDTYRKRIQREP